MPLHAVISDLDGVIVNSEDAHYLSFKKMMRQDYGIEYDQTNERIFLGTTDIFVFETLKKKHPKIKESLSDLIQRRNQYYFETFGKEVHPLPGILDFFKHLQKNKIPLAIGTNASRQVAQFVIDTLSLKSYIQTHVCADDVNRGKPDPELFLKCAEKLEVDPKNPLVIEDSNYGVQAAKAAGMKCIAIPCGPTKGQDHSQADLVLKSATELTPKVLDALF